MNISELMEQYAQAVATYEKRETILKNANNDYFYAVGSADESFWTLLDDGTMGHDIKMETKWRKLIPERQRKLEEARIEFAQAKKNLEFIHESYILACKSMNSFDAMKNHFIAEKRYLSLKDEYDNLVALRETSNKTGEKYDRDYGYSKAAPFYNKGTKCYYKMREIEPIMRVYKGFANHLKFLADKKQSEEFGPKKSKNK